MGQDRQALSLACFLPQLSNLLWNMEIHLQPVSQSLQVQNSWWASELGSFACWPQNAKGIWRSSEWYDLERGYDWTKILVLRGLPRQKMNLVKGREMNWVGLNFECSSTQPFGIRLDTVLVSCSESNLYLGRQDGETVMDHVFGEETSTKQVTWTGTACAPMWVY